MNDWMKGNFHHYYSGVRSVSLQKFSGHLLCSRPVFSTKAVRTGVGPGPVTSSSQPGRSVILLNLCVALGLVYV